LKVTKISKVERVADKKATIHDIRKTKKKVENFKPFRDFLKETLNDFENDFWKGKK
jgi:hypothetical protein